MSMGLPPVCCKALMTFAVAVMLALQPMGAAASAQDPAARSERTAETDESARERLDGWWDRFLAGAENLYRETVDALAGLDRSLTESGEELDATIERGHQKFTAFQAWLRESVADVNRLAAEQLKSLDRWLQGEDSLEEERPRRHPPRGAGDEVKI
jgi:hypothetical protein